ncbi:S1 family peptidase [Laspinema olomoucense]|uniref:Serine protease n=1 Tax=Laspinema olomoucense D3b TaxID=2953688 RepID=A0ABT2NAM0_9CYAN|nr:MULTISPECIES: serine protease [unclassified Laspinema]MCT7971841.1 serine protease [Laspinema sp. D3d]MCT7979743.1 serine protease [Laspinema sp. D3b]MCT7991786.1 serine protease [Laspinema sp. D3a]MCT7993445.1 serine protease [Laspinema sp. D3c]
MLLFCRFPTYWVATTGAVAIALAVRMTLALPVVASRSLAPEQVNAIASQTTVIIAQGLQEGDIEARQEWNPGSGVIVARDGNTYSVLTALHVVRTREVVYGVRTSDGKVHQVDDVETQSNIIPLGEELGEFGETIQGLDLAIVTFNSDQDYPIAVMGDSPHIDRGAPVYISGWPNPEDESARRVREFREGNLTDIANPPSDDGGYSLLYTNETKRGMSGGPVFNQEGELVGIHGRGRAQEDRYCVDPELSQNNSCGIQTLHFIDRVQREQLALSFAEPPVNPEVISHGITNMEQADTIEDIYKDFTFLRSLLRDGPSGGCSSLLLGEPCN